MILLWVHTHFLHHSLVIEVSVLSGFHCLLCRCFKDTKAQLKMIKWQHHPWIKLRLHSNIHIYVRTPPNIWFERYSLLSLWNELLVMDSSWRRGGVWISLTFPISGIYFQKIICCRFNHLTSQLKSNLACPEAEPRIPQQARDSHFQCPCVR